VVPGSAETSPGESPRSVEAERPSAAACKERLCAVLQNEKGAVQCFDNEKHAALFADLLSHYGIDLMKPADADQVIRFYRQNQAYLVPGSTELGGFLDGRDANGAGLIDVAILRGDKQLVYRLLWVEQVSLTESSLERSEAAKLIKIAEGLVLPDNDKVSSEVVEKRREEYREEFQEIFVEKLCGAHLGEERPQPKAIDTLTLVIDTVHDPVMQNIVFEVASVRGRLNYVNRWGETPLTHACKAGKLDCVKSLLFNRADLELKNDQGKTARRSPKNGRITISSS
jgi:hypothetical protein